MDAKTNFIVSTAPHLKTEESTSDIMKWVSVALAPAFGVGFFVFGWYCLFITLLAVLSCVITEALCQKLRGMPVTVGDFSAVLSGLLLAAVLPPNVSWWVPVVGGVFAMAIAKQAFGGLGSNIWNPALLARAFLQVSLPTQLNSPTWPMIRDKGQDLMQRLEFTLNGSFTEYSKFVGGEWMKNISPISAVDAISKAPDVVSQATPLTAIKQLSASQSVLDAGASVSSLMPDYAKTVWNGFIGMEAGCIAEISALALLMGGLFLMFKKIISWEIPFVYLATVALLTWVLPAKVVLEGGGSAYTAWFAGPVLLQLVSGGLLLGAFFMDTDYVTTPMTFKGKVIFALGCGILTAVIRLYSTSYPEGCCYSILIMNTCVPLIDAWTKPRKFGTNKIAA